MGSLTPAGQDVAILARVAEAATQGQVRHETMRCARSPRAAPRLVARLASLERTAESGTQSCRARFLPSFV
jgi:hypothetical protein